MSVKVVVVEPVPVEAVATPIGESTAPAEATTRSGPATTVAEATAHCGPATAVSETTAEAAAVSAAATTTTTGRGCHTTEDRERKDR